MRIRLNSRTPLEMIMVQYFSLMLTAINTEALQFRICPYSLMSLARLKLSGKTNLKKACTKLKVCYSFNR